MNFSLLPWWLNAAGGAVVASVLLTGFYTIRIDSIERDADNRVLAAQVQTKQAFVDANTKSEERGNELQANYNSISAELQRLRNHPAKCLRVTSEASEHNGTPQAGLPQPDGISSGFLLDLAGDADDAVAQLAACQGQLDDIYKANGQ